MNKKFFTLLSVLIFIPSMLFSQIVGKIVEKKGRVDVFKNGANFAVPAHIGDTVSVGDVFRAKSNSFAKIEFFNKNILQIFQKSKVKIDKYTSNKEKKETIVNLYRGKVQAKTARHFIKKIGYLIEKNKFEVHTPTAVAGVKGTNFIVFHFGNITGVLFLEGHGYAYNPQLPDKTVPMKAGQITFLTNPSAPPTEPREATEAEMKTLVQASKKQPAETGKTGGKTGTIASNKQTGGETGGNSEQGEQKSGKAGVSPKVPENLEAITAIAKSDINGAIQPPGNNESVGVITGKKVTTEETGEGDNTGNKPPKNLQPITEEPQVAKQIADKTPPKIDEFSLYKNFIIPKDKKVEIKATDNKELSTVTINNKEASKVEGSDLYEIALDALSLNSGLNNVHVKATDVAGNSENKILKIFYSDFIPTQLSGKYVINNSIKGSIANSFFTTNPQNKGAASIFINSGNPLPEIKSLSLLAGGEFTSPKNNKSYWILKDNKFMALTDDIFVETDNSIDLKYDDNMKSLINNHLLTISLSQNFYYTLQRQDLDNPDSAETLTEGILKLSDDNKIFSMGKLTSDFSQPEILTMGKDDIVFNTDNGKYVTGIGVAVFNNKIYGLFGGYKETKLANGKLHIDIVKPLKITGKTLTDIEMIKFQSDKSFELSDLYDIDSENDIEDNIQIQLQKVENEDYTLNLDVDYVNFKANVPNPGGVIYGDFNGTLKKDLTKSDNIQVGVSYNNNFYFTANLSLKDEDNAKNFLSDIKEGVAMSKTKISTDLQGYAIGNYNTKNFKGFIEGTWHKLKYVAELSNNGDILFNGLLGSSDSLLGSNLSKYYILSEYKDINNTPDIFSMSFKSFNYEDNTETTYQKDAFNGFVSLLQNGRNIAGNSIAFYSNKDGDTGILKEKSLSGEIYNDFKMTKLEGEWEHIKIGSENVSPEELTNLISDYFTNEDSIEMKHIDSEEWGIFRNEFYSEITTGDSFITGYNLPDTVNTGLIKDVFGYGAKFDSSDNVHLPSTWISISDIVAVKNSDTFTAIATGAWIETSKFIKMANNEPGDGTGTLSKLNIPYVQVGQTALHGEGNNLNITMKNVTFFATSTGEKPKIWATNDITGSYTDTPNIDQTITLSGNNNSLNADFTIKNWTNNKWAATISNGQGTLSGGSFNGEVKFKGVAAGTYFHAPPSSSDSTTPITPGTIKGTAAGVVTQ